MVNALIQEIASRGIRLALSDGGLAVNAPPGSLTEALKNEIRNHRDALIDELAKMEGASRRDAMTPIMPDPENAHLPFSLSDLQFGFYMANDPYMEYHVRPHCYMETERGGFDIPRYEAAWNKALTRHALGFHVINADLMLEKIEGPLHIQVEVNDFRALGPEQREHALEAVRARLERRELPLDAWPWFDLCISQWYENGAIRHRIHYNHNSFFIDGYATTQFLAEIEKYYEDPELALPDRTLSYRDAVIAVRELEFTEPGQRAKSYWLSRLPGLPPPPDLPQVSGIERRCRSMLDRRAAVISKARWDEFKRNANANKITPSNAIIAAYAYVISIWSQSDHFIFSQMVTRRFAELHTEIKTLIGNFASLYPLEIRLDRTRTFCENASCIQDQVMADIRNLQFGGMQVMQELNRLKGGFGTAPSPFVVGSGLFMKEYRKSDYVLLETSQTLLDHQFFELPDGTYYYVWDLIEEFFPVGMIAEMWRAFARLLDMLCDEPDAWTATVRGLMDVHELEPRLACNRTGQVFPESLLHQPLAEKARAHPMRIAVRHAGQSLDYAQLNERSDHVAALIGRFAWKGEKLVAVAMPRCRETIIAVIGILKAGAAYVPIDPNLPERRREFLIRDIGTPLVLTTPDLRDQLVWPESVEIIEVSADEPFTVPPERFQVPTVSPDALAYVIYTSGTTGRPKGVMIEHHAAMNTVQDVNRRFGVGADDRLFGVSPFNFDLSVYDIFGALEAGGTIVYPEIDASLDPLHWLRVIASERVTVWNTVPALMSLLTETAQRQNVELDSLRLVLLSGDKIPTDLPERIRRVAPNVEVIALGGATEASIWSIAYPLTPGQRFGASVPYGFPMANQRWHIHDRYGEHAPTWVSGELMIAGTGLARGYYLDEEKTTRSFIVDPDTGERLYRTGDLGRYLPDGCIEIHGRVDDQVKIQGYRIELGEIEATLLRHPDVRQAVVVVRELGARKVRQLVAYLCTDAVREGLIQRLEHFLQQELPIYMTPQHWLLLDDLPRTANGKIDRNSLGSLAITTSKKGLDTRTRRYVAPRTGHEHDLAAMWQEVLQIELVGVEDDFFDLGGQSFDAIRIFTLIKNRYGRLFSLGDIWQARTVAAFARKLEEHALPNAAEALVAIDAGKPGLPVFLVHPAGGTVMGYVQLGQALARPSYGFQACWRADGRRRPHDIPELAAEYVALMLKAQSEGPYTVGGWSSGGAVAFEIARQLEDAGKTVDRLFLLDAPAPWARGTIGMDTLVAWFIEDLAMGLPIDRLPQGGEEDASPEVALDRAVAAMQPYSVSVLDIQHLLPIFRIFIDMEMLVRDYVPSRLSCDITVVRVEEDVVSEFRHHPSHSDADWGWGRFGGGLISTITTPGNHHTFLSGERVRAWVKIFTE